MLQIHCVENKPKGYNSSAINMLSTYKLKDNIVKNKFDPKVYYNETLEKQEFTELLIGVNTKEALFPKDYKSVDSKRQNIELYTKLYLIFADKEDGISSTGLAKCLETADQLIEKNNIQFEANSNKYLKLAEEIISLLGTQKDRLTPEDFINIMTSEAEMPIDLTIK